jgi:hypothetical protein
VPLAARNAAVVLQEPAVIGCSDTSGQVGIKVVAALPDPVPSRVPGTRCSTKWRLLPVGHDLVPARAAGRVERCSFLAATVVSPPSRSSSSLSIVVVCVVVDPPQVEQRQAGAADRALRRSSRPMVPGDAAAAAAAAAASRAAGPRRRRAGSTGAAAAAATGRAGRSMRWGRGWGRPPPRECRRRSSRHSLVVHPQDLVQARPCRTRASSTCPASGAGACFRRSLLSRTRKATHHPFAVRRPLRCFHAILLLRHSQWDTTAAIAQLQRLLVSVPKLVRALSSR